MSLWEEFTVEEGSYYLRRTGPLKLWIKKELDEWIVGWKYESEETNRISEQVLDSIKDNDITWHRKVVRQKLDAIKLSPVMPDRAVVVKPESELKITREAEATFFVRIPLWVRVCFGKNFSETLYEIPSVVLSNTWFGEPYSGELCYSLTTSARRSLEQMKPGAHLVICPIHIQNSSSEDLTFNRLCVHVDHLSIYQNNNEMWANKAYVHFRGTDKESNIKFEDTAPKTDKKLVFTGQSRKKGNKSFVRKSFDTFKIFTNGA